MDTKEIHAALAKTLDSCSTVKMLAADSKPGNESTDEKALPKIVGQSNGNMATVIPIVSAICWN